MSGINRSIRVPADLDELVARQAAAEERTYSSMVVYLLRRGLNGSYPAPPPLLAVAETEDELGERVVRERWPEQGTNVPARRKRTEMCEHRVAAGSFCKRCDT